MANKCEYFWHDLEVVQDSFSSNSNKAEQSKQQIKELHKFSPKTKHG